VHPSSGFADRVMAAVVAQPRPQPAAAAGMALRRGRFGAMLAALADSWRITFSGDHPLAVRAQAMAFVLIAIVAVGSLGGVAAIGAARLLGPAPSVPGPAPSEQVPVSQPTPSPSIDSSDSAVPTDPSEASPEPTETAEPTGTDDSGETPRATRTPKPTETAEPHETEDSGSGSDHGGEGGGGGGGGDDGGGD
ncbi:MAG: hypothetical protein ACXWWR_09020, partial [Candidatus Limnocylindrales bacterium]